MAVFRCWLKPMETLDPNTLKLLAQRLRNYLDKIISATRPKAFTNSVVGFDPNPGDVQPKDVLVYLVRASLIAQYAEGRYTLAGGGGAPGGRTAPFSEGVLSEVYLQRIASLAPPDQAASIANAAIHEIAHNKFYGMPEIADYNMHVHVNCGGGILSAGIMPALLRTGDLTAENARALAPALAHDQTQLQTYLTQKAAQPPDDGATQESS